MHGFVDIEPVPVTSKPRRSTGHYARVLLHLPTWDMSASVLYIQKTKKMKSKKKKKIRKRGQWSSPARPNTYEFWQRKWSKPQKGPTWQARSVQAQSCASFVLCAVRGSRPGPARSGLLLSPPAQASAFAGTTWSPRHCRIIRRSTRQFRLFDARQWGLV